MGLFTCVCLVGRMSALVVVCYVGWFFAGLVSWLDVTSGGGLFICFGFGSL